jgi:hypothetical protein
MLRGNLNGSDAERRRELSLAFRGNNLVLGAEDVGARYVGYADTWPGLKDRRYALLSLRRLEERHVGFTLFRWHEGGEKVEIEGSSAVAVVD